MVFRSRYVMGSFLLPLSSELSNMSSSYLSNASLKAKLFIQKSKSFSLCMHLQIILENISRTSSYGIK